MKQRLISALIAIFIMVPLIFIGGLFFKIAVYVISIIALKEFMNIRSGKKELPSFIKFIAYIIMSLIILANTKTGNISFMIDYRILAALFALFLLPTVLYHDRKKYSVNDAFYMIGGVIFLGISLSLIMLVRNNNLTLFIYLLIISIITDTYAYITGMLIGKHKLLESISPNKTWEGMIGGTVVGVFVATVFYYIVVSQSLPIYVIILITTFLSILGQLGDLVFSAIKRYFDKKDFSNIMPGHGGILDRIDSIIFIVLGFIFFIKIL